MQKQMDYVGWSFLGGVDAVFGGGRIGFIAPDVRERDENSEIGAGCLRDDRDGAAKPPRPNGYFAPATVMKSLASVRRPRFSSE